MPLARGRSRSDSIARIVETAKKLAARGHKELVLTGVHIGMYGKDLEHPKRLLDVIINVEKIPGVERIRLSSLEPLELTDSLLDWIGNSEKICHHFHIPLQNGDDVILKRMRRNYNTKSYEKIIQKIKQKLPNCGVGTDVILGFPGETESQFENTVQLIKKLLFSYLHVFSYSKRPGTKAAQFSEHVDPGIIKKRSEFLRQIADEKKHDFYTSQIGKIERVLWEEKTAENFMFGWTDNYVRVRTEAKQMLLNQISQVKVISKRDKFVDGEIVDYNN